MSFNEMNTIENALWDHLVGKPVTAQTGMVTKEIAEYIADNRSLKWKYVEGIQKVGDFLNSNLNLGGVF